MKIAVLFNGGYGDSISGGDVHILKIINELSKNNEVHVFFPEKVRQIKKELDKNKKVIKKAIKEPFETKGKFGLIRAYMYRAKKSIKILEKEKYDLVIASTPFFCDVLPLKKLKGNTKIISYIFHILPGRKSKSGKEKIINFLAKRQEKKALKIIKKKADLIFTCNCIEKSKIIKLIGNKKVKIAGIGIDTKEIDKIKESKEKNSALFIGRIVRQKGVFDLIGVMKEAIKKKPKLKLKIIGTGPEKEVLSQQIKKEHLEKNILILGFVSEKEKIKLLKKSEYFFFPSYEEEIGIVIAEALYSKCKVVCYELSHYREFFREFPEYVPIGDQNSFSQRFEIKRNLEKQKQFIKKFDSDQLVRAECGEILNLK